MDDSHRFSRAFTLRRLPRSLMVAALACLLMAAPAAARALIPSTTTAVSIKITTHPATDARTTTAKFAWKATGTKLSVSCRLGSGKYAKCSKTHTYANMKPGAHSFTVRAVSGKTTRTAVYKWTVDTTAPTAPTVSGGSPVWTNLQRHDHGLRLDGYRWHRGRLVSVPRERRSGRALVGGRVGQLVHRRRPPGRTWVQFRAVDKAGNASAWASTVPDDPSSTAMIDKVAPTVPGVAERRGCVVEGRVRGGRADRRVDATPGVRASAHYQYRTNLNQGHVDGTHQRRLHHDLGRGQDRGRVPQHRRRRKHLGVVVPGRGVARPHRPDVRDLRRSRHPHVGLEQVDDDSHRDA